MNETADLNDPIVTLNNVQETVPVSYCSRKERLLSCIGGDPEKLTITPTMQLQLFRIQLRQTDVHNIIKLKFCVAI